MVRTASGLRWRETHTHGERKGEVTLSLDREKPDLSGTHPHIATGDDRDISGITGLPLRVDRTGRIEFLQGLPRVEPQPRALDEMRSVL